MNLYEFLEENLNVEYNWEDYAYDDIDIPEIKENYSLLCDIWDLINEWAPEYADDFRGVDAALIVRILNETLIMINSYTVNESLSLSAASDLCSIYAKCCVFVKNEMAGTELYDKCKFVVNNTIANCIECKKEPCIELADVDNCDPEEDCWEEI